VSHLLRSHAPISEAGWAEIDGELTRSLKHFLAGRKLVDFTGPKGWDFAGVTTGDVQPAATPVDGVEANTRQVRPLVEFRTVFDVPRAELDAIERGKPDPSTDFLVEVARRAAMAEDGAVFHGYAPGQMEGIGEASPHDTLVLDPDDFSRYTTSVATAVATLKAAGVDGPYAIALGPRCYTGVIETTEHGGYPLLAHLRLILDGPVIWAPAVNGAVVLSQRGDDFELVVGEDFSVGYLAHDADTVTLYLEESLTFVNKSPEAAVRLAYAD
jgi:uncharacterized linocin/CFP29 family protein